MYNEVVVIQIMFNNFNLKLCQTKEVSWHDVSPILLLLRFPECECTVKHFMSEDFIQNGIYFLNTPHE